MKKPSLLPSGSFCAPPDPQFKAETLKTPTLKIQKKNHTHTCFVFLAITRSHEVRQVPGVAEMNPTGLPDLF